MDVVLGILRGIVEQGLIYGIMALGVYISYHILNFPDLSVDGTFPLGAAVAAMLALHGVDPYLSCLIAFLAGAAAGLVTGVLHVKLRITDLLSGILVMTALYSVNLRIAGGTALLSINGCKTIFNSGPVALLPGAAKPLVVLAVALLLALAVKYGLDWYLTTKSGMLLRAAGDNAQLVSSLARDPGMVKIVGLSIANGLAALSGAVLCQQQKYFDVNMGTGMIVMGLAAVLIGMAIFRGARWLRATSMVLVGSILYKACLSAALNLGFNPNDLKLIMAALFTLALLLNNLRARRAGKGKHAQAGTNP